MTPCSVDNQFTDQVSQLFAKLGLCNPTSAKSAHLLTFVLATKDKHLASNVELPLYNL